jgi:hypothetical protein
MRVEVVNERKELPGGPRGKRKVEEEIQVGDALEKVSDASGFFPHNSNIGQP